MPQSDSVLLDTHAWIWLVIGNARLERSKSFASIMRASTAATLYVSAISVWETAMLEATGRLVLSMDIEQWVGKALGAPGLSLVPLLPAVSIESCRLPGEFHGDPADRIIVATARHLDYLLVTADTGILDYGDAGHCRTLEA
jgi:PIN domain nuclease of toxin-antitoxin system